MPPNRRKPTPHPAGPAPTPARRPKVAGLRRPRPTQDEGTEGTEGAEEVQQPEQSPSQAESAGSPAEAPAQETSDAGASDARESDAGASASGASAGSARPGPRRKARDTGRAKPSSLDEAETADVEEPGTPAVASSSRSAKGERQGRASADAADTADTADTADAGTADSTVDTTADADDEGAAGPKRVGYAPVAVLLVVGLVLAGLAVFFHIKGSDARAATSNAAMVDMGATSEVTDAMSTAAERLFSIDYNDLGKSEKAAEELLAGDEVKQKYDALMGEIKRLAPEQKIVVTVHASRSAVVNLDGDRARVMVFIDQSATRASDQQSSAGGAAMWLETEKLDGQWKVTNMDTYAAEQPAGGQGESGQPSGGAPLPGDQNGQQGGQNGQQGGQQGGQNGGN